MNHYGTLEGALSYHEARGNSAWTEADEAKQKAALVRASSAIDGLYANRFSGKKTGGRTQELAWPRIGSYDYCADEVIPDDEVPLAIENATYAAALEELKSPGAMSPSVTTGRIVKRQKVDSIEREFFGDAAPTAESMRLVVTAVDDCLKCLIAPISGSGNAYLLRY